MTDCICIVHGAYNCTFEKLVDSCHSLSPVQKYHNPVETNLGVVMQLAEVMYAERSA